MKTKTIIAVLFLILVQALMSLDALAQPGPQPSPFAQNGNAIVPQTDTSCLTMPSTVTGGCPGAGAINAHGLYVDGVAVFTSALSSGKIWIGSVGNVAAQQTPSGNCTITVGGVISCTNATVTSTGSTTGRTLAARFAEAKNVLDYGATGNGTTDDGTAIAAAIAAAQTGGAIYFPTPATCYKITTQISVTKALTLYGSASKICQPTANTIGISITASNSAIDGLVLSGPTPSSLQSNSIGIYISGTFNTGIAPTYISNVTVTNTKIENWNGYGMWVAYVQNFQAIQNSISDVVYGGITVISGNGGRIEGNSIDTVNANGTPNDNAYGVQLTRQNDPGELTSSPNTTDYAVVGNIVKNVPTWEGIDTHSGERIVIAGNVVHNTYRGIAVGASSNNSNVPTYAPHQVAVTGNTIISTVTNGSRETGISFTGVDGGDLATGSIVGNTVSGHGKESNSISAGIFFQASSGLTVSGNSLINPSPTGIAAYVDNAGFSISSNAVVDPWSDTVAVGEAVGIRVISTDNTGVIDGNAFSTNGKSATYLLTSLTGVAIRVDDFSGTAVTLGQNRSSATSYLSNGGNRATSLVINPTITGGSAALTGLVSAHSTDLSGGAVNTLYSDQTAATVNGTNNTIAGNLDARHFPISAGVSDSGYRVALRAEAYASDAGFLGTLADQYGVWARNGANVSGAGSTITNSYGVYVEALTNGNTTITNLWGVYQATAAASNYFAGKVGIGTTPSVSNVLTVGGNTAIVGSLSTAAPSGSTSGAWKLGAASVVSPTSPNRTVALDIGGTVYYLAAKTTND